MTARLLPGLLVCLALLAGSPARGQAPRVAASAPASAPADGRLPADLPLRRDPAVAAGVGASGAAAWLLVLAVALGGLWLVRRARSGNGIRALFPQAMTAHRAPRILASRTLGPHLSVQVIEWNGKELLLGCTQHSLTVLDSRPAESGQVSPPQGVQP